MTIQFNFLLIVSDLLFYLLEIEIFYIIFKVHMIMKKTEIITVCIKLHLISSNLYDLFFKYKNQTRTHKVNKTNKLTCVYEVCYSV